MAPSLPSEEAVTGYQRGESHRLTGEEVVPASQGPGDAPASRGRAGDEIDCAADGVGVHVGSERLVDLDGLDHVGGHEVELHRPHFPLRGGDALAVERDRVEAGFCAADQPEAGFPLVVGDDDAGDPLDGVADVGVGKPAHLIGGDDVGDVGALLLLIEGAGLSLQALADDYDLVGDQ